jgi:hypothetical protein
MPSLLPSSIVNPVPVHEGSEAAAEGKRNDLGKRERGLLEAWRRGQGTILVDELRQTMRSR